MTGRPGGRGAGTGQPRAGTVLMLPGRAYRCDMPLLAATTTALQVDGWRVQHAVWDPPSYDAVDPRAFVEEALGRFDVDSAEPVVVVAKSLGTLAAHRAAEDRWPAVWLTPVLRAAGDRPLPARARDLRALLLRYPAPNLVVGGTADPLWVPGFRGSGEVLEVPGADHSMETADVATTLRTHQFVATRVADFARPLRA